MKDFAIVVFIALVKVLVTALHDISFGISCIMEPLTWQEAVDNCISTGGSLVSFRPGIGSDLDKLNLNIDTEIWIASYLLNATNEEDFCGFRYLNRSYTSNAEVFFGHCDAHRNYFCKTKTATEPKLVVYNSTRANVSCNETVSSNELLTYSNQIKSGLYWSTLTLKAAEVEIIEKIRSDTNKQYCGAYNRFFGKYFANCSGKRLSLCGNFDASTFSWTGKINTQCFDVFKKQSTSNAKQPTFVSKVSFVSNKKPLTSDSNMFASSSWKAHITTWPATESEIDKISIQGGEEKEKKSDLWINVVVPLGVVLSLTFGITLIIYIYRKRLQKREIINQPTNISNLTTVSGQNDYETLEHHQGDEHKYSSARQVDKDRVAMNTYVNDVVYRNDK